MGVQEKKDIEFEFEHSYFTSGWGSKSLKTRRLLLDKFPEELSLWNEFGVGALTIGRVEDARQAFQGVRPDNSLLSPAHT